MAIDYAKAADGALAALAKAGMPVTLHTPSTAGGYVPGVGVVPDSPGESHEGVGALLGYRQDQIDGTSILQGDQKLLLAPQIAKPPQAGWMITAGGTTYSIKHVERVAPAGVAVLYKLQLRGA